MKRNSIILTAIMAICSCSEGTVSIYPDYKDVTIPCNIAPLNFYYTGVRTARTTFECNGVSVTVKGKDVRISPQDWQKLLDAASSTTASSNTTNSNTASSNANSNNTARSNTTNSNTANSNTASSNANSSNTARSNTTNSSAASSNTTSSSTTNRSIATNSNTASSSTTANSSTITSSNTASSNTARSSTTSSNTTNSNTASSNANSNNTARSNTTNSSAASSNTTNSNTTNSNTASSNTTNSSKTASAGDIIVKSSVTAPWVIHVSKDSIDSYLTYRLIEPGYEVWDRVEICERNISNFQERPISSWKNTDNSCMNCHIHKGRNSMFYLRGPKGGAILNLDGKLSKLSLKNRDMISSTVYGDLHPNGRWGIFSTNIIIPGFHTQALRRLEVYDTASDLTIADFRENRMLNPESVKRADKLETFPCFTADGRGIFYCCADTTALPEGIDSLRYSLLRADFDPETGSIGTSMTVWDGPAHRASACHPKASPDGRYLMFTVAAGGTFPIWHRECGLGLIDLKSGEFRMLDEVNSDRSDTYHSWSSNSRWFVFASKRGDGKYGKPYFAHIDSDGQCSKPFVLPQEDPHHYDGFLKSYNIPDLGTCAVPFDTAAVAGLRNNVTAVQFK